MTNAEIVADYWATDHKADRPRSWLEHPTVLRHVNRRVTGDPNLNGITWFQRAHLKAPVEMALSLGCGLGGFERDALRMDIAQTFEANDISPGAIRTAVAEAEKAGLGNRVSYSILNMDEGTLPDGRYNVVFGLSSIHHVFQLERLFKQVRASLKSGGLFYLGEYIARRVHWAVAISD